MKIEGTHQLKASRPRVYELLIDPEALQRCIPGCERLEQTEANTYSATIRAGVGAIKGVFTLTVRLEDMQPPEHYRIVVSSKGAPGFLKGTGDLDLQEEGEGHTHKIHRRSAARWDDSQRWSANDPGNRQDDGLAILHSPGGGS